jgi:hypothetical protein
MRRLFVIDEGGNPPEQCTAKIRKYPTDGLTVLEKLVFCRIENALHLHIQRGDPVGIARIQEAACIVEFPEILPGNFDQLHFRQNKINFWS